MNTGEQGDPKVVAPAYPIRLTEADDLIIKKWAEHDQLWTTRETVEFNLRTFARVILKNHEPLPPTQPR